jgi:hypothetical protein
VSEVASSITRIPRDLGFRLIREAIREPGAYVDQLTSFPRHCRQMEPLDHWQARAVYRALTGKEIDPYS